MNFYLHLAYIYKKANSVSPSTTESLLLTYVPCIDTDLLIYLLIFNFRVNHSWSIAESYEVKRKLANKINDHNMHDSYFTRKISSYELEPNYISEINYKRLLQSAC